MSKKKVEREIRAAHRRNKKERQNQDNEFDDFVSLNNQLGTLGLSLKQVQGDGNCLFRTLGDQLDGTADDHLRHRQDVVDYMRRNRGDFEPFVEDDISFECHLRSLGENGTFGGNDSIVAFARLHDLTIVIHQLNKPVWQIHGGKEGRPGSQEVHISYHNGDHYNSVRRTGDRGTVPVRIRLCGKEGAVNVNQNCDEKYRNCDNYKSDSGQESDYENSPNPSKLNKLAIEVAELAGCEVSTDVFQALEHNAYCVQAAVDFLLNDAQLLAKSSLWSSEGSGARIFGENIAHKAVTGRSPANARSAQDKLDNIQHKLANKHLSNKRRKELKKTQRKINSNEKKKAQQNEDSDTEIVLDNVQSLTI